MHASRSDCQSLLDRIESSLGAPAFRHQNVLIYHGDSLTLMRRLSDQPFALTVTSPPYNIGKEYEQISDSEDYLHWCATWLTEVHRLTRADGALWLNLGYVGLKNRAKAIPIPYLLWDKVPFYLLQEIVWQYGAGVAARKSFSPRNEKFLWYVKNPENYTFHLDAVRDPNVKYPTQKKNGKLKCNPLGKNPSDVWSFPKVTSGAGRSSAERTPHPAQFPASVIERVVRVSSDVGDVLFDPFLGSGTVAEVGLRLGRAVVGMEINDRYVEIAVRRVKETLRALRDAQSQSRLFGFE